MLLNASNQYNQNFIQRWNFISIGVSPIIIIYYYATYLKEYLSDSD